MASSTDPIRSLAGAIRQFSRLKLTGDQIIVFRGHAKHDWRMRTKILRCSEALQTREGDMVRELISIAPQAFSDDASMFDRLVRMQHFGLPTRLLDTTSNPLVALYFATEEHLNEDGDPQDGAVVLARFDRKQQKYFDSDTVSCLANLANLSDDERKSIQTTHSKSVARFNRLNATDRLVQFVRNEKPAFRPKVIRADLFKRLHVVPKLSNPRIVAQSGSFILFGLPREAGAAVPIMLRRLIVSADRKKAIRRDLERLGITESSLFPELDKAASHIVARLGDV